MATREGELTGEIAIITGSGVNTGSVIAATLACAGAAVVVNYRKAAEGAAETVRTIERAGGRAIAIQADLTILDDVHRLVDKAAAAFGAPTILVNNASVRSVRAIMDITAEEWRATLATTLDASFFCVQACLPHMRAKGHGTIVNIGGISAHTGRPERSHVAAAKGGLAAMTASMASELAPSNITVNCIVPGKIDVRPPSPDRPPLHMKNPMARAGEMQEIADLVRFLCGSGCRFMTGQMLHANGGAHMSIA